MAYYSKHTGTAIDDGIDINATQNSRLTTLETNMSNISSVINTELIPIKEDIEQNKTNIQDNTDRINLLEANSIQMNFSIKNYSSINSLLADTSCGENTIGVVTSTPINRIEFLPIEPRWIPQTGDIWIQTGDYSNVAFASILINNITLNPMCPLNVKQYLNGNWTTLESRSYIGNVWIPWTYHIYKNGDLYESITGGWTTASKAWTSSSSGTTGGCGISNSIANGTLTMYRANGSYNVGMTYMVKPIDLTKHRTLKYKGTYSGSHIIDLCIWSGIGTYIDSNLIQTRSVLGVSEQTIDISSFKGNYYIGFRFNTGNKAGTQYVYVNELYLEA